MKGVERPLRVFEVQGEIATARGTGAVPETPFVGRGPELEVLRLLFERAVQQERANLVTIVGPPGIGKSRLSQEVVRSLGGGRVVRGRCLPYGDGLTYWPLAEILKTDAGILDSDDPATILEKALARLESPVPRGRRHRGHGGPALVDRRGGAVGPARRHRPERGGPGDRATRGSGTSGRLTADGPIVAMIEDIHWADPSMLELIGSVADARCEVPALILCMARPDLFERRPDWGGGLSNATTISLAPLSARGRDRADRSTCWTGARRRTSSRRSCVARRGTRSTPASCCG